MGPSKRDWIRIHRRVREWAAALKHEAELHGRPNRFNVAEMAGEYDGIKAREGYYVGRFRLEMLWTELGGHDGWGSKPTYSKGWFYV